MRIILFFLFHETLENCMHVHTWIFVFMYLIICLCIHTRIKNEGYPIGFNVQYLHKATSWIEELTHT